MTHLTQIEKIDEYIKKHGSISHLEAAQFLYISNSRARMKKLRDEYPVKSVWVKNKQDPTVHKYMRYYYNRDEIKFPPQEKIIEWCNETDDEIQNGNPA